MARCPRDGCGKQFWTVWKALPCPLQWDYEKNPWWSFSLSINYSYFVCECTYLCLHTAHVHTLMFVGTVVLRVCEDIHGHGCVWEGRGQSLTSGAFLDGSLDFWEKATHCTRRSLIQPCDWSMSLLCLQTPQYWCHRYTLHVLILRGSWGSRLSSHTWVASTKS